MPPPPRGDRFNDSARTPRFNRLMIRNVSHQLVLIVGLSSHRSCHILRQGEVT